MSESPKTFKWPYKAITVWSYCLAAVTARPELVSNKEQIPLRIVHEELLMRTHAKSYVG